MAFNSPASGDTVAHTDITQLIKALDGSAAAGAGEPIKITKVNDAANHALDVQNSDTVAGYGLRVRNQAGTVLLRTDKTNVIIGSDLIVENSAKIDTLTLATHNHNTGTGMGVQIPTAGIEDDAVTAAKVADGAIDAAAKIADGIISVAKLDFDPATQTELDTHAALSANAHGLGAGVYPIGSKQGVRRLETKAGTQTATGDDDFTITITWDNAFSSILAVASMAGPTDGTRVITLWKTVSISATGVSHTLHSGYGSGTTTFTEYFIGIGT